MAVFTAITHKELEKFISEYEIGILNKFEGISAGIENSNFFVETSTGSYVLTIFEVLKFTQLPYYIEFMLHLANKGVAVPKPQRTKAGELISNIKGKPAIIATKQGGKHITEPTRRHCHIVAKAQAQMHIASKDFKFKQNNLRGLSWWEEVWPSIKPFLNESQISLYEQALSIQKEIQNSYKWKEVIPRSACHCDLFRDNVLIIDPESETCTIGGIIDFYFSGDDALIFDLAVAINDWCIDRTTGDLIPELAKEWIDSYASIRPITSDEVDLWPYALQAAALRFWTSRLYDFYLPRDAENLKPHDPTHFEKILKKRLFNKEISLSLF